MSNEVDDGAWFAPKRFGLGSGLPIRWQGWALLVTHASLILLGVLLLGDRPGAVIAWAVLIGLAPLPVYAAKTRGGWRWRWGGSD